MVASDVVFDVSVLGVWWEQDVVGCGKGCSSLEIGCSWQYGFVLIVSYLHFLSLKPLDINAAGGIAGLVGNPGGACVCTSYHSCDWFSNLENTEIVMVRLQGDFAKQPEKRFNYKHCFDALFRVRLYYRISSPHSSCSVSMMSLDVMPLIRCVHFGIRG